MKILAIETSCDETAAAVVERVGDDKPIRVLSSIVATSLPLHVQTGGVVPEVAAREQLVSILPVITQALQEAAVTPSDLDAVGVTQGPGLIGSLLVGVETAKVLALTWKKPLIAINHLLGHVLVNWITTSSLPQFPALGVVVSGGHTDLVIFQSPTHYDWIGGTRDDAAGECFDKAARLILNAAYPGGPAISKAAEQCLVPPQEKILPRPMIHEPTLEMSFSGLKTAVLNEVRSNAYVDDQKKNALAFDLEQAIVDVLSAKIRLALETYPVSSVVVGGGVVANRRFREQLTNLTYELDLPIYFPPLIYCSDNAAMIGAAGILTYQQISPLLLTADPSLAF